MFNTVLFYYVNENMQQIMIGFPAHFKFIWRSLAAPS